MHTTAKTDPQTDIWRSIKIKKTYTKKPPKQTSFWEEQKSEGTASIQFSSIQILYCPSKGN